jgi:hypothetical protein
VRAASGIPRDAALQISEKRCRAHPANAGLDLSPHSRKTVANLSCSWSITRKHAEKFNPPEITIDFSDACTYSIVEFISGI